MILVSMLVFSQAIVGCLPAWHWNDSPNILTKCPPVSILDFGCRSLWWWVCQPEARPTLQRSSPGEPHILVLQGTFWYIYDILQTSWQSNISSSTSLQILLVHHKIYCRTTETCILIYMGGKLEYHFISSIFYSFLFCWLSFADQVLSMNRTLSKENGEPCSLTF